MAPPRPLVGVSLKMYFSLARTQEYINDLVRLFDSDILQHADVFVIPDFLSIPSAHEILATSSILLGAQDCFWEDKGAYTGEVSPANLAELGCRFVEIGHAERRSLFKESDEDVVRKAEAAARNGLVPLVCIGENLQNSVENAARDCIGQIKPVLEAVASDAEIVIAYEPVWAIGQPEPASAEYVVDVIRQVRSYLNKEHARRPGSLRILYGGSAGPGLFSKLSSALDGLFLGRFAHDIDAFRTVAQEIVHTRALR